MTAIPSAAYFSNPARTNQQAKQAQDAMLAVLRELLGGSAETTLTIASGAVTPTAALHAIDTEGAASSDDLTNILTTNHPEGRLLVISPASDARDVVVKHAAGGAGQILLADGADLTLSDGTMHLVLKRAGTDWKEVARFYGKEAAAARAFLGAAGTGVANTFGTDQTIQSSDAGASAGPVLTLDRASPSPAVSDELGNIVFRGRDAGGNATSYADIYSNIQVTTDGAEDGALIFRTMQSGTLTIAGYFNDGLVVGSPTGTDMGTGTINATEIYRNGKPLIQAGTPLMLNPYAVNTTVTQAHGLGGEPSFLKVVLECLASEGGYSTGHRIILSAATDAGNISVPVFRIRADATNLVLVTHQIGRPNIVNGLSRDNFAITPANWKLEITPYLVAP